MTDEVRPEVQPGTVPAANREDLRWQVSEQARAVRPTRGPVGMTMAEEFSFINVREIDDWCKDARQYRPSPWTAMSTFAISAGLLAGFVPAWQSTNAQAHAGWWGVFLAMSLVSALACFASLLALAVRMPAVAKKLRSSAAVPPPVPTPLERLAERMEKACREGRPIAAAATAALEREGRGELEKDE